MMKMMITTTSIGMMIDMNKVSTEKILTLIRDNSNLPFYVFVSGDDVWFDDYTTVLQEITDIDIDYITTCPELDDGRVYVKSWDYDDMSNELCENMSDVEFNEMGAEAAFQACIDKVESLDWEKCIIAWASNPA